jgi:hypothetical protein
MPRPAPIDGVPRATSELLLACLIIDPSKRPGARELADALGRELARAG